MDDCMTFPDTVEEFMDQYKVVDTDGIYMSKGAELVPIFRMRQWLEHLPSAQSVIRCKDCKHFGGGTYCYERDGLWDENDFCSYAERKEQDDG